MRSRISRLGLVAGAAALSLTLLPAAPVGAAARPPKQSLANVGSDVAYFMMNLIDNHYQASSANTNHDIITTVPAFNSDPFPASVTEPADGVHPAFTWDSSSPAPTPPNGGSAGVAALEADKTGLIAFARGTSSPKTGETAYRQLLGVRAGCGRLRHVPQHGRPAKGLDPRAAAGHLHLQPGNAPAVLHRLVAGRRQAGWHRALRTAGGCGNVELLPDEVAQWPDGRPELRLVPPGDAHQASTTLAACRAMTFQNAIFVYEWADWRAQKTGFSTNLTNGSVLGKFGISSTSEQDPDATNVNEKKTRYQGTRYIYNVSQKVNHPASDKQQLNDINRLIGVRPKNQGGPQYICSGKAKADISKAGYVPLAKFATGGIGLGQSFCRLNPTPL